MSRRKKAPIPTCSWCGAKFRAPKPGCPRGYQCAKDERNHDSLIARGKDKK